MEKNKSIFLFDSFKTIQCHICGTENKVRLKIFNNILQMQDNIYCSKCKNPIFYDIEINYKITNSMSCMENVEKYL